MDMGNTKGCFVLSQNSLMVAFVAVIFVLAVVYSVFSATTVSTNITTDGTLRVTGAATITGVSTLTGAVYASSTLQATGDGLFYGNLSAGASTNTPTTTLNVTGSGYFTGGLGVGFATTGAGQIHVTGLGVFRNRLGVTGTTSPYQELGVTGDAALSSAATTTISTESTGSTVGSCLELKGGGVRGGTSWVRIYVGGSGATNSPASGIPAAVIQTGGAGLLVIEAGRCQ